jgi:outer membrane protein assembly factor BamB
VLTPEHVHYSTHYGYYTLRRDDGTLVYNQPEPDMEAGITDPSNYVVVAPDGNLVVQNDPGRRICKRVPETGEHIWCVDTPYNAYFAPAIAADGTIYTLIETFELQATSSDGQVLWRTPPLGTACNGVYQGGPVVDSRGMVYVLINQCGDEDLFLISPSGEILDTAVAASGGPQTAGWMALHEAGPFLVIDTYNDQEIVAVGERPCD